MLNPFRLFPELKRLRAENETLRKAVSPEVLLAGGPVGMLSESPQLGVAREAERHMIGWVFAAIRPISQRMAAQPLRVARRVKSPRSSKRINKDAAPGFIKDMREGLELVETHPILDSVESPNDYMTRFSLLSMTVMEMEMTGRAFWLMADDGIWPFPASWIEPVHRNGLFTSFIIRPRWTGTALQIEVPGDSMVRFHYPDPSNPIRGSLSPLQAAGRAIETDENIQECQRRIFSQGVFPGLAIIAGRHPDVSGVQGQRPMLTREQRAQLITSINQQYRGAINYNNPIILDALISDIKKISNSPAELDFASSCQLTKDRIFQSFGVPAIIAGEVENANRATAAVADSLFCSNCLNPKLELLSQWLSKELPPRFDDPDCVVWLEPARPRDEEATREDMKLLGTLGCVTRNEMRSIFNFPKLETPDGDELIPMASRSGTPATGGEGELPANGKFFLADESDPASAFLEAMVGHPQIGRSQLHNGTGRLLPSPSQNGHS